MKVLRTPRPNEAEGLRAEQPDQPADHAAGPIIQSMRAAPSTPMDVAQVCTGTVLYLDAADLQ
ncbi:MAG: hypothetical protein IPK27_03740 [Rhodanobacteraceae bacterium]|nr:hypothetical protein [Rhodanobacteraceae bacterium]